MNTTEEEQVAASADLAKIRALMERAGQFSHISGVSTLAAGLIGAAGAVTCMTLKVSFNDPKFAPTLAWIWGGVFVLALGQSIVVTIVKARQRAEPAWSHLNKQVALAMFPALFVGGAITAYGFRTPQLDLLPPLWMLAYGSSLMGMGLFAGWRIQLAGATFLLLGAAALFLWMEHGLLMMLVSFGGIHVLLGGWITWKPRA